MRTEEIRFLNLEEKALQRRRELLRQSLPQKRAIDCELVTVQIQVWSWCGPSVVQGVVQMWSRVWSMCGQVVVHNVFTSMGEWCLVTIFQHIRLGFVGLDS